MDALGNIDPNAPMMMNPNAPAPAHLMLLQNFWQSQLQAIDQGELDFKTFQLPLARIKKVMKCDDDVKMISAEAPIIFAKACEIFILELTLRAWIHTEESKRRTLQRNDVAAAISKTDVFDFLIDIVPRDESRAASKKNEPDFRFIGMEHMANVAAAHGTPYFYQQMQLPGPTGYPDQMMYYPQQQQPSQQQQQQQQPNPYQYMSRMQQQMNAMGGQGQAQNGGDPNQQGGQM